MGEIQQGGINSGGSIRDGLEGNFREGGLPPCIQSHLECLHGWSVHNLLWQLVPVPQKLDYAFLISPIFKAN